MITLTITESENVITLTITILKSVITLQKDFNMNTEKQALRASIKYFQLHVIRRLKNNIKVTEIDDPLCHFFVDCDNCSQKCYSKNSAWDKYQKDRSVENAKNIVKTLIETYKEL